MDRFRLFQSVLIVLLLGFASAGAHSAVAQEATPAAETTRCPSPLATPIASPTASSMATPTAEPVCVGVIEGDFYIRPQLATFRVGQPYVFAVGNEGAAAHEFVIEPAGAVDKPLAAEVNGEDRESEIEDITPGETAELEWTFTEPGRYQFACHLPGHYEAGMKIEVVVVG
jgi:uncharacterized cupredoxin-like copper-binding protein